MLNNFRNIITALLSALICFILSGCKQEPIINSEKERHIVVSFFSESILFSSQLKSTATTDEGRIDKVVLFGFDSDNNIVTGSKWIITNPDLGGEILSDVSISVKTIYAIANPTSTLENANPVKVADLAALTADYPANSPPKFPFLMSGKGTVTDYSVTIKLYFAVAKIEITSDNFTITSVTVKNTPDRIYVFNENLFNNVIPLPSPTLPSGTNRVTYSSPSSLPDPLVFYVAENNGQNPTQFEVTGRSGGNLVSRTFTLTQNDILRNNNYPVNIKPPDPYKNGIKVLAIGNSYAQGALLYMYDLLTQLGVPNTNNKMILITAFIPSASLNTHATNAKNNASVYQRLIYSARGNYDGSNPTYSLSALIREQEWDVITLQQESSASGRILTYNQDLDYLINYVKTEYSGKWGHQSYRLGWHLTWAYASSNMNGQPNYNNDQRTMYDSICNAVQKKIVPNTAFDFIIPVGTAIQNARQNDPVGFGDNLNRDGTHLNNLGCYLASTMWVKTITGYDISKLTINYNASNSEMGAAEQITQVKLNKIVNAVNAANDSPFISP